MDRPIFFKTLILKGKDGAGVQSVEKTGTSGTVDTYTITFTDGNTATFTVTNGSSIDTIELTDTSGLVDTYTITLTDGSTSTFTVTNGESQTVPTDGVIFYEGAGVPDGYEASDPPMTKTAVEMSYARYQTLTDAEKNDGTIYMVYDDPTDNYVTNNGRYGIDYSLNEQATGKKWVDGKPIYQKTLLFEANDTLVNIADLNIDNVVDYKGLWRSSSNAIYPLDTLALWGDQASDSYFSRLVFSDDITGVKVVVNGWTFASGFITLYYTKTTDTV